MKSALTGVVSLVHVQRMSLAACTVLHPRRTPAKPGSRWLGRAWGGRGRPSGKVRTRELASVTSRPERQASPGVGGTVTHTHNVEKGKKTSRPLLRTEGFTCS